MSHLPLQSTSIGYEKKCCDDTHDDENQINEREQLELLTIEQLISENHLVHKLEAAIDFHFIYPLVEKLYTKVGRPSINPAVLFKMAFIPYTFGLRSMRQTIKEIETNIA